MFAGTWMGQGMFAPDDPIEATFVEYLGLAQPGTRTVFSIYTATLPDFFDGIKAQVREGIGQLGLFDHTQAAGRGTVPKLADLLASVGQGHPAKPTDPFRVGTSSHGAINHFKAIVQNVPLPGDPWPEARMFADWRDAMRNRYPCVWSGSWNFTPGASLQNNNVDIVADVGRAQAFVEALTLDWQYVDQHEQRWNLEQLAAINGDHVF